MKRFIILGAVAVLGGVSAVMYTLFPQQDVQVMAQVAEDGELTVTETVKQPAEISDRVGFSLPSGFYSENIGVELTAEGNQQIWFTTDGSDPSPDSASVYTQPIEINATAEVRASTIKAAVQSESGELGEIYTVSYVIGQDVDERFDDDTLVFVLSTDPYNLYDYEYGIAVPGKVYDDYVKEHPGEEIPYNAPGNYFMTGREWERPIYVEVFESDGTKVIDQAAGVRLSGGYSRVPDQKSLRLIARKDYDPENGKFKYAFFPGAETENGVPVTEFDRLVLRNGANDREFAGVRDELSQKLAQDYGYPVTQHCTPAAVFLNGEYYGFSWLHENYNEDYLATYFGGNKDSYEIVSNTENAEEGNERGLADYAEMYALYDEDLTDDKVFDKLCSLVDIDNLMQYYCMQIFISNKDWPGNNYKAFRYYPEDGEELTSEYMDGRWRFMFFDAEFAWSLYGERANLNTLKDLLNGTHMSGESKVLQALLQREDMREKFASTMADITAYAFEENHIKEVLDELCEISDNEQFYALEKGITSTWARKKNFEESREQIRSFAEMREFVVFRDMFRQFEWEDERYTVSVTTADCAVTKLSTQKKKGRGIISAEYHVNCSVPLCADIADGWEFVRWEINGQSYDAPEVIITADMADDDGKVIAKLITQQQETSGSPVQIKTICTEKKAGYFVLYNPNSTALTLSGLYLTDKPEDLQRWQLPAQTIEPYGELLIVTDNNKTQDALRQLQAGFSLKKGETLMISDSSGNIIASVDVPDIPEGKVFSLQTYGEYRLING
ncbi:MAG: CotH kinase family protein [Oscillospiraceae bacterium]